MSYLGKYPQTRLRRLRQKPHLRALVKEVELRCEQLVLPLFIKHGRGVKKTISSMPGHFQLSLDHVEEEIQLIKDLGLRALILFGIPEKKDGLGSDSYAETGIIQQAIPLIKSLAPEITVMTDLCFCEYTDHGHCGVIHQGEEIDNDQTLKLLAKQAVSHAKAGADVVAPSGMMDGMVKAIREGLDAAGFLHTPILSYSVKYASAMYGPFREAAEGSPRFGDRKTHQLDYANIHEALRECALDVQEGTDMLMVKPAHTYLDVIHRVKEAYPALPLGAYHTSGEYAMIKAAAEKGWMDERSTVLEVLTAIRRAGADFILTYFAKDAARWLKEG